MADQKLEQEMQEEFLQAQTMVLIGQLAGGIASEFNSTYEVVLNNITIALDRWGTCESLRDHLHEILEATARSAKLASQLLAFSRYHAVMPIALEINMLVERALPDLKLLIGERISLVWIPDTQRGLIQIDPAQIELLLMNFCINSSEAITGAGCITIETRRVHIDKTVSDVYDCCCERGDYVILSVSDNGCGIEKKDLPHIYEPFFTTKEYGKGYGMGLSAIYGIVKQHNARIECKSERGKGTIFTIWFSLSKGYADLDSTEESIFSASCKRKRILLVEDEPDIMNICKRQIRTDTFRQIRTDSLA